MLIACFLISLVQWPVQLIQIFILGSRNSTGQGPHAWGSLQGKESQCQHRQMCVASTVSCGLPVLLLGLFLVCPTFLGILIILSLPPSPHHSGFQNGVAESLMLLAPQWGGESPSLHLALKQQDKL